MKTLSAAFIAVMLLAAPAFAGGFTFDLPTLTWPEPGPTQPVTKGCINPADPAPAPCA